MQFNETFCFILLFLNFVLIIALCVYIGTYFENEYNRKYFIVCGDIIKLQNKMFKQEIILNDLQSDALKKSDWIVMDCFEESADEPSKYDEAVKKYNKPNLYVVKKDDE